MNVNITFKYTIQRILFPESVVLLIDCLGLAGPIFLKYIQIFFGWMNIQSIVILQCQSLNPRLDILWAPRHAQTPAALRHL